MEEVLLQTFLNFSVIAIFIALAPLISKASRIPIVVVEMCLGCFGIYFGWFSQSEVLSVMAKIGFLDRKSVV